MNIQQNSKRLVGRKFSRLTPVDTKCERLLLKLEESNLSHSDSCSWSRSSGLLTLGSIRLPSSLLLSLVLRETSGFKGRCSVSLCFFGSGYRFLVSYTLLQMFCVLGNKPFVAFLCTVSGTIASSFIVTSFSERI